MVKFRMQKPVPKKIGLAEALAVAKGELEPCTNEGGAKLLAFILRDGECTVELSDLKIAVWYSWLPRPFPSTYCKSRAPGLVGSLMELGGVQRIVGDATFQIGPGCTGTGSYVFEFKQRWVRIRCEEKRIVIRVRDDHKDLDDDDPNFYVKAVQCERCGGELRTPLAKQCLCCGYDWH